MTFPFNATQHTIAEILNLNNISISNERYQSYDSTTPYVGVWVQMPFVCVRVVCVITQNVAIIVVYIYFDVCFFFTSRYLLLFCKTSIINDAVVVVVIYRCILFSNSLHGLAHRLLIHVYMTFVIDNSLVNI